MMNAAEFLYPSALEVTPVEFGRILLVGTCVAATYMHFLRPHCGTAEFDHLFFNNVAELPDDPPRPVVAYDFQLISLPLRDVVTDRMIRFSEFDQPPKNKEICDTARATLKAMLAASLKYNQAHGMMTFVSNFTVPGLPVSSALDRRGSQFDFTALVQDLNHTIQEFIADYSNVYLLDVDSVGSTLGKRYFSDDSFGFYFHSACWSGENWEHDVSLGYNAPQPGRIDPLPKLEDYYGSGAEDLFRAVWRQMVWLYRAVSRIDPVKLVVFDLDDTLWRGQIAEHYQNGTDWPVVHGWPLGVWEAVQHLRARGILVAICSKNDEGLVRERWDRAVQFGWLTLEDFTFVAINWEPKVENIRRMIEAANLTAKSVVFVDDNPVEREAVRTAIAGIRVIGENPYGTKRQLLWSAETQIPTLTAESARRDEMTRKQQNRETERSSLSREEFLIGLRATLTVKALHSEAEADFPRAFELLNKTNQFNTTGERWDLRRMRAFLAQGGRLYVFWLEDKFTQYGLVGVICYRAEEFIQFAMSCRVLGLDIETSILNAIMAHERPGRMTAWVIKTEANMVCRDVYARCGFRERASGVFEWDGGPVPPLASHLRLVMTESCGNSQSLQPPCDDLLTL